MIFQEICIDGTLTFDYHLNEMDELVQEKCKSSAVAMELRLSCTNSWIYAWRQVVRLVLYNDSRVNWMIPTERQSAIVWYLHISIIAYLYVFFTAGIVSLKFGNELFVLF